MAKAKTQPDQPKTKRSPLFSFWRHQRNAMQETGLALVSLLPKEFRAHTGNAVKEGKAGFEALLDGVIDTVEGGLQKLRPTPKPKEDDEQTKVKVEVS